MELISHEMPNFLHLVCHTYISISCSKMQYADCNINLKFVSHVYFFDKLNAIFLDISQH